MTFPTGLAEGDVLMVDVAHLADGRHAVGREIPKLAGGEPDQSVLALFRHELSHVAGCTDELGAFVGVHFHIVDKGTDRDVCHGKSIAGLDVGVSAAPDNVAHFQAVGSKDVTLFAVLVLQQRNVSRTIGVVLDGLNRLRSCRFCPA